MTDPAPNPPSSGMKPWVRVVLGLSLAANLLVVGLAVGVSTRLNAVRAERTPPTGLVLFMSLPKEDRKDMRAVLRESLPPPKDRKAEARELAEVLRASPLDRAALTEVVRKHGAQRSRFQSQLEQAWIDHVVTMDDAARAAYAENLIEISEHGFKHGKPAEGKDKR